MSERQFPDRIGLEVVGQIVPRQRPLHLDFKKVVEAVPGGKRGEGKIDVLAKRIVCLKLKTLRKTPIHLQLKCVVGRRRSVGEKVWTIQKLRTRPKCIGRKPQDRGQVPSVGGKGVQTRRGQKRLIVDLATRGQIDLTDQAGEARVVKEVFQVAVEDTGGCQEQVG